MCHSLNRIYLPYSFRTQAASTQYRSSTTRAADLSTLGWFGIRARGSAVLCRIAGPGGDEPEEDPRACIHLLKANIMTCVPTPLVRHLWPSWRFCQLKTQIQEVPGADYELIWRGLRVRTRAMRVDKRKHAHGDRRPRRPRRLARHVAYCTRHDYRLRKYQGGSRRAAWSATLTRVCIRAVDGVGGCLWV